MVAEIKGMNRKAERVGLYVRVSTIEQYKEGYSIGEQIDRLKKYCDAMGWTAYKVYTDSHTGSNMERPALQEMIRDVQSGKLDKVLVYKLDRLSRSQKDTLYLIEDVILENDTDFVCMTENFDTATPFGKAMIGILAVFAQLEREQIKERMTMGKEARAKQGKWSGGRYTPLGYDYVDGQLEINEFQALIVKEIFEKCADGVPMHQIESSISNKGYQDVNRKLGGKSLRYILKNRLYAGYIKTADGWIKGLHTPLVDLETFEKANDVIKERKERYESQGLVCDRKGRTTYLGGLIFCKHCGGLYAKVRHGTYSSGFHFVYNCYSRSKKVKSLIKDPNCKNKIYKMDFLDNLVFDEIRKLEADPNYRSTLKKRNTDDGKKIQLIEKEIKSLDEQLSRFLDLYGKGKFSYEDLDKKTIPLEEQKHKLQAELENLQAENDKMPDEKVYEIVSTFSDALERGDFLEIRGIIEALIEKIVIDNDKVEIHWNFV